MKNMNKAYSKPIRLVRSNTCWYQLWTKALVRAGGLVFLQTKMSKALSYKKQSISKRNVKFSKNYTLFIYLSSA